MLALDSWKTCLYGYLALTLRSSLAIASPILAMDMEMSPNFVQTLRARQTDNSSGNSGGGGGGSTTQTTLIFAATLGSLLGIFLLFALYSFLRNKLGWKMPAIPMPDPPSYRSLFRMNRRNPEDGPPLPLYMEQPNNSTTVLQRSESRRTHRSSHSSLSDHSPIGRDDETHPHLPPPYMKDPPEDDSPLSSPVSLHLPPSSLSPPERLGRDLNRSRTT